MEWMILPLKRYADFRGRSRRKEYWMFMLFYWIVSFVIMAVMFAGVPWSSIDNPKASVEPVFGVHTTQGLEYSPSRKMQSIYQPDSWRLNGKALGRTALSGFANWAQCSAYVSRGDTYGHHKPPNCSCKTRG